jgi:hypothetical protein
LAAARLAGWYARLVLPRGVGGFLDLGELGELGQPLRRNIGQSAHSRLDGRPIEVAGVDRHGGSAQAPMNPANRGVLWRAVRGPKHLADLVQRPNLASRGPRGIAAHARQRRSA